MASKEYVVEKIVASRINEEGLKEYYLKWAGLDEKNNTWKAEKDLDCTDLISIFEAEKAAQEEHEKNKRQVLIPEVSLELLQFPKVPEDPMATKEYVVEKIIDSRINEQGKKEYYFKWVGLADKHNFWMPEEDLDCADLISAFEAEENEKRLRQCPESSTATKDYVVKKRKISTGKLHGWTGYSLKWLGFDDDHSTWLLDEDLSCPVLSSASADTPIPAAKEYVVEKILRSKINKKGVKEYYVKYAGFNDESNAWKRKDDLDCPNLISAFEAKNSGQKKNVRKRSALTPDVCLALLQSPERSESPVPESSTATEEHVVKKRKISTGKLDGWTGYSLKWLGFDDDHSTWLLDEDLSCPVLSSASAEEKVAQEEHEKKDTTPVPENYAVEKIIGSRINEQGKKEYYLKWVGFDDQNNTWKPEDDLDCPDLISVFEAEKAAQEEHEKSLTLLQGVKRSATPDPESSTAKKRFVVEKVIDSKINEQVVKEYYLKWVGFDDENTTGKPEKDLDCPDLLSALEGEKSSQEEHEENKETEASLALLQCPKKDATPVPEDSTANEEYEVEKIIASRINEEGVKEYCLKLVGFDDDFNIWMPEEDLDYPDLLSAFDAKKTALEEQEKNKRRVLTPVPGGSKDSEEYVVEKIIASRINEEGVKEYYLKWIGYNNKYNTWKPEDEFDCKDLIWDFELEKAFQEERKRKKVPTPDTGSAEDRKKVGFDRGLAPAEIIGAKDVSGQLMFLIMWAGTMEADLVPAREVNVRCPQMVIRFYEERLKFESSSSKKKPDN